MESVMRDFPRFFAHLEKLGFSPATVIDVGVAGGTQGLYDFERAYYILIEALPDYETHCRNIVSRLPGGGEYHMVAVSDANGEASFFRNPRQLDGSTMVYDKVAPSNVIKVPMWRMDSLLQLERLRPPILLKTDIQGQDLACIKGLGAIIDLCEVILMEVSMFGSWGKGPDFVEVVRYMDSVGWVPYDIAGYLTRQYDNALGQVDIAFVKREGRFRTHKIWN